MTDEIAYRAFLSYSHSADRATAKTLQRRLEAYVLPPALRSAGPGLRRDRRPLRPVFRDEDELVPGQDLPQRIRNALRASEFLIILCTPQAAGSPWVEKEILDFARLGRWDRILAVVAAGEPNAAARGLDPALECLPPALRFRATAQGELTDEPTEPLWIDWRSRQGERPMFLRLVAALLSLPSFDQLVARDRQARNRALAGRWAAAALLLVGLPAGRIVQNDVYGRRVLAAEAREAAADGRVVDGRLFAVAALPFTGGSGWADQAAEAVGLRLPVVAHLGTLDMESFALSADGRWLAFSGDYGPVQIWDAAHGHRLHDLPGTAGAWLEISADGSRLIVNEMMAERGGTSSLWDPLEPRRLSDLGGTDAALTTALALDGSRAVTEPVNAITSAVVKPGVLWDAQSAQPIAVLPRGSEGYYYLSRNGSRLITRFSELWDAREGRRLAEFQGVTDNLRLSDDGRRLVVVRNGAGEVWDAVSGRFLHALASPRIENVILSPDGRRAVLLYPGQAAGLWDIERGVEIAPLALEGSTRYGTFVGDGTRLVLFSYDGPSAIWDAGDGRRLVLIREADPIDTGVTGGALVALNTHDGAAWLWTARDGRRIATIGIAGTAEELGISADGSRLVARSSRNVGTLFDATRVLSGDGGRFREAICAASGEHLPPFTEAQRSARGEVGRYLRGRPWRVCDWRGLDTREGWAQMFRRWRVRARLARDYGCAEIDAAGRRTSASERACLGRR
jgi:WD40 repeat protein